MPERQRKQKTDSQRPEELEVHQGGEGTPPNGPWSTHGRAGSSLQRAAAHGQAWSQWFPDWNTACQRPTVENRKGWKKRSSREKLHEPWPVMHVGLLKKLGVTCSNDRRAREVSGLKPGNGEEELGIPVNLGEKMSLEKGRIDGLNVCASLFPSTRTSNEIFMLINHELS